MIDFFKRLQSMRRRFRILRGWSVRSESGKPYKGQCDVYFKAKRSTVYSWGTTPEPEDYIFHELLHVALRAYREVKGASNIREVEEQLIRDICSITYPRPLKYLPQK